MCWSVLMSTSHRLMSLGRSLNWESAPTRFAYRHTSVAFLSAWSGRAQSTVGDTTPRQEVLECIRKEAEQASKYHNSMTSVQFPLPRSPPDFLAWLTSLMVLQTKVNKTLFFPSCFWLWCFTTATETLTKTDSNLWRTSQKGPFFL